MSDLARKIVVKAHHQQLVLRKNPQERIAHVHMKAFLWSLYLPQYPEIKVEYPIGDRFKPDLIALDLQNRPQFWGEAGMVSPKKYEKLLRRFPETHFAFGRWGLSLQQHLQLLQAYVNLKRRKAPVDVIVFPENAAEKWIQAKGEITLQFQALEWLRLEA